MYPESWRVDQASYERWFSRRDQRLAAEPAAGDGPLVSVVMPVFNTEPGFLVSAIESVRAQKYRNWQLCIADDSSTDRGVVDVLRRFAALDQRIRVTFLDSNAGIAGASNSAAELADGEFVALMDHDDVLHPEALNVVVRELARFPETKFLYTDSDHLDANGHRCNPFFKPGYDYFRFLGQNYLNHLTVIRRDLLEACHGWKAGYEGSQDYDFYLRVVEKISDREILHVPEVLYHWRDVPGSVARSNLGKAVQAARLAIRHHFERAGIDAGVKGCPHAIIYNRVEWPLPTANVQLVVYGENVSDLDEAWSGFSDVGEQLSVHISSIVSTGDQGGLIDAINEIVATSGSDYLCLLDARLRPVTDDWLHRLTSISARVEVGLVSAKLFRSDGRLAYGPDHQVGEEFVDELPGWLEREDSKGYIANLCLEQEVAAVQPGLLFMKTSLLRQLEGLPVHQGGLSASVRLLCRRVTERGQRVVWSPHVRLRYSGGDELSSSGDPADIARDYGATIPARLAANPNIREVAWEVNWKEGAG